MTKKLICSRATEETVLENWPSAKNEIHESSWGWAAVWDLSRAQTDWLDLNCQNRYFLKSSNAADIYFENPCDMAMYVQNTKDMHLAWPVMGVDQQHLNLQKEWCCEQYGESLKDSWPTGNWLAMNSFNNASKKIVTDFIFKTEEQAVKFSLTWC